MSRPNPAFFGAFLIAVWAILGGVTLFKGGFFLAKHEGDTFHLLQIVFRMVDGEWPHLDFMTPIGIMAFAPIAVFVELGSGIGHAILLAQMLVALVLLPAVFWTGWSRLGSPLAYLFGLTMLVLVLALVHGEAERSVSISMHYNRWAWAVSYVAILLAILPPRAPRSDIADGAIIGLCMAFLMLCKMTYFAAFAIPVVAALLLRRAWRSLGVAVLAGLGVCVAITMLAGIDFWPAYLGDLLTVARSDVRPQPGQGLKTIVGAPAYLGASMTLIAGVILLRQSEEKLLGLMLLLLAPGFFYVTYQNWANDPQWLMLLAILLLVPRPEPDLVNGLGWNMQRALAICATAALAFAAPSFLNLLYSPFRHLSLTEDEYVPMLAAQPRHHDLRTRVVRANRVDGKVALDRPGSGLESRAELAERDEERTEWRGEVLPDCELTLGLNAWFETVAADLEASGYGGAGIFGADIFMSYWLFGDFDRLENGAPWYYGRLPGFEDAEYLLVPLCPSSPTVRKEVLAAIEDREVALTELRRTPLYVLYKISGA